MGKKDEEPYLIFKISGKKRKLDTKGHDKREERKRISAGMLKENLRVLGKKRKKTKSEEEGTYSIYTGSYFSLSNRDANKRKKFTLEIILLLDRYEVNDRACTCISIEEWNSRSHARTLTRRSFYKDREGNWMPGKCTGFAYLDLLHILKDTKEGDRIRLEILRLLEGPEED